MLTARQKARSGDSEPQPDSRDAAGPPSGGAQIGGDTVSHDVLCAVLELMVFVGSDRSGGLGRCGASTLALSQLIDLNILEFHTPF